MSALPQVTVLLKRISDGDGQAIHELFPMVYDELRRKAHFYMTRERSDHTLQATALVNEVYLKMLGSEQASWQNRAHFYGCAARAMRQILVDYARAKQARGGRLERVDLDRVDVPARGADDQFDWEGLDLALRHLEEDDPRRYQVTMYRYFAGMPEEKIAEVMRVSTKTIERDWEKAKRYLAADMASQRPAE